MGASLRMANYAAHERGCRLFQSFHRGSEEDNENLKGYRTSGNRIEPRTPGTEGWGFSNHYTTTFEVRHRNTGSARNTDRQFICAECLVCWTELYVTSKRSASPPMKNHCKWMFSRRRLVDIDLSYKHVVRKSFTEMLDTTAFRDAMKTELALFCMAVY
jgi:hypothetical protein